MTKRWSVALIGKCLADRRNFIPFIDGNGAGRAAHGLSHREGKLLMQDTAPQR